MTDPSRIGQFDVALFERFRASKSETVRRILLDQLMLENDRLTHTLVGQLLGRGERRAGQKIVRRPGTDRLGRIPGAEILEWDDALQTGRIGMQKALKSLDLSKGKLAGHALSHIHYELQKHLSEMTIAKTERGNESNVRAVFASSYDDGEGDGGQRVFDALTHAHVERENGPAVRHDNLALAHIAVEREQEAEDARRETVQADPVGTFVGERLRFGARFRETRRRLIESFEAHVRFYRVAWWSQADLRDALRARGATPTVARFADVGVAGAWQGVRLQIETA